MLIPLLGQSSADSKFQGIAIVTTLFLFLMLSSSSRRLGERCGANLRCEIEYRQRSYILEKLLRTPWKSISRLDQADLDTALTSEVSQAVNGYVALLSFVPNLVVTIGMFTSTLFLNPLVSGFSVAIGYIAFRISRQEAGKQAVSQRALSEAYVDLNRETSSLITNLKFLRSSGYQEDFFIATKSRFRKIADLIYLSIDAPSRAKWITDISGVFLLFLVLSVSVIQDNSVAKSLVFIAILFRLTPKMQNIQSGWILVSQQSIWMTRWTDRLASFQDYVFFAQQDDDTNARKSESTNILISNVTVSFSNRAEPALKNISISVGIQERVALVGHSGSGKSTLIDLITGVVSPDTGEVRIRGKILFGEALEEWKKEISWTPQIPALRTGTIYQNIAWLGGNVSNEASWLGLEVAELDTFIKSLPDELASDINPKTELSGGQGQRLALARAVAREPVLLILDETTSSLDEKLETQIASNLAKLDCGLIIATHRLGPLQICTRTIEFDEGVIIFDGPTHLYLQKRRTGGVWSE